MSEPGLRLCSKKCMDMNVSCPIDSCRLWIDYEEDNNCTLVAIYNNGSMTLRQIAERSGISFARVKQIESKALEKIRKFKSLSCFQF